MSAQLLPPITYGSLLGGVNYGTSASEIKDNQLAQALNLKPAGPWLRVRGGARPIAQGPQATFGFTASERLGQWAGVFWGGREIGYFTGANLGYVPIAELAVFGDSPWNVAEWQRTLYAARLPTLDGALTGLIMVRLGPDMATLAGLVAPTFIAAVGNGGQGSLTAGNYQYVFTYYDSLSGSESSYGPVSNTFANPGATSNSLTNLVASDNPRVDSIRIYRTFPNGTGAWYRVATIPHTQVSYGDDIPVTAQGPAASATNGLPPSGSFTVVAWRGRLWVTDGEFLYPSKLLNPEAFNPADAIAVGSPADKITGLLATDDALIVGRQKGMSYVTGTGATSWDVREADATHGLLGPSALTVHDKAVYWLSLDGLYLGSGVGPGRNVTGQRLGPRFSTGSGETSPPSFPSEFSLSRLVVKSCATTHGVLFTVPSTQFFLYQASTDSLWPWEIGDGNSLGYLSFGPDAEGRLWTWTSRGSGRYLLRLDDESYYLDHNDSAPSLENQIRVVFAPKFVNLGARKGLIHEARIQWSGTDPVVVVDSAGDRTYDTTLPGNVELRVYRQGAPRLNSTFPGSQRIQAERVVPFAPKAALGKPDYVDEWKAYRLGTRKTAGFTPLPSNTLGLVVDFNVPAETSRVLRPFWIGGVQLSLLITDLPERVF